MKNLTIAYAKELMDHYGENTTLKDLLIKIAGNKIYKCPKCNGMGYITVEYNGYPKGLSDSGFVYEAAYKDVKCDLCNGEGYTADEYKHNENFNTEWIKIKN